MNRMLSSVVFAVFLCCTFAANVEAAQNKHRHVQKTKTLHVLPSSHLRVSHRGKSYFYTGGRFYRHEKGAYVTIAAPFGAVVPVLPRGYVSFGVGINRYFYFQGIYYRRIDDGYEVVKQPAGVEQLAATGSDKLIVYPAAGQSDEQRDKDRYECHVWAITESQFDPTDTDSDPLLRTDYTRAIGACLEARNYVVK